MKTTKLKYHQIINSGWFSDLEGLRSALLTWSDSKVNKSGTFAQPAFDADYIARYFTDDAIQNEVIKRIPQKWLVEVYNNRYNKRLM